MWPRMLAIFFVSGLSLEWRAQADDLLKDLKYKEGDEKTNEMRALKAEVLISTSEDLALAQARKLLKKYKGTPIEPDLHFRISELYVRKAKTHQFLELNRESETLVRAAPALLKTASSKKQMKAAIDTYEMIGKRFPRYGKMDLVTFNHAFALQQMGRQGEAEKKYWLLIQRHPQSPLVADSHLAIGEINFSAHKFSHALEHFESIKKYPDSRVYPYGLYKGAWSLFNLQRGREALQELEAVIAYGRNIAATGGEGRLDLRKEALTDMTLFMLDVIDPSGAFKYLSQNAAPLDVGPYALRLARLYERYSRWKDRRELLAQFIRASPESPDLPAAYEAQTANDDELKKPRDAVASLRAWKALCEKGSAWLKAQKEPLATTTCRDGFSEASLRFASRWLKAWRREPQRLDTAEAAEAAFALHLDWDGEKTPKHSEARFAYAELLFQRQKFRLASEQYERTARTNPPGPLAHQARYGAIVSLQKAVAEKWNDADEKRFQGLVGDYLKAHPTGEHRLDLEFKVALIAYEKGRLGEAAPQFKDLGDRYAKVEKGIKAQDLFLDILGRQKDYARLRDESLRLQKVATTKERRSHLTRIFEEAYFLVTQAAEEKNELASALAGYEKFAKDYPSSSLAEKAAWNAVGLRFKIADPRVAAREAVEFAGRFPKSKESSDALVRAAKTFEDLADLRAAAEVLERLGQIDEKERWRWTAVAADFWALENQMEKATPLYRQLWRNGSPEARRRAWSQLFNMAKSAGRTAEAARWLEEMASSNLQPDAAVAQAELAEEMLLKGQEAKAFAAAKKVIGIGKVASPAALARARWVQARVLDREFRAQSLKTRLDRLSLVLALKTEKLDKTQEAYQAAIRYGDGEIVVVALENLADAYSHFVESLRRFPRPPGLSDADDQVLRQELGNLALPMEEKIIATLEQALRQAQKLHMHGGSIKDIQKKIDKFNMQAAGQGPALIEPRLPGPLLPEWKKGVGA